MHSLHACAARTLLFLLSAGASAPSLSGQTIPSPYRFVETRQEVGLFAGTIQSGTGQFGFGPRSGPALGARYGIDVSGPFGLEGSVTYLGTQRDLIDPRRAEGDRIRGEGDVAMLLMEARLRFTVTGRRTWHRLAPFVFAGAGGAIDLAGTPAADELLREADRFDLGFSLLGLLGGGVRMMLGDNLLLRGDAQLTLSQLDTPDGFQDTALGLEAVPRVEWVNNGTFTIGLAYRF